MVFLFSAGVLLFWLALQVQTGYLLYDHAYYYLQQIFWAKTQPLIPGLANFNMPLGFSDAFFLFTAMTECPPFIPGGYRLSVSILMAVLIVQSVHGLIKVFKEGAKAGIKSVFLACVLVPALLRAGRGFTINVASPDTAIYVLTILVGAYFLSFLDGFSRGEEFSDDVVMITILSTLGLIIKNSFFLVGPLVLLATYLCWFFGAKRSKVGCRVVNAALLFATVGGLSLFFIRNILVTGYLLYQPVFFPMPVDWVVPSSSVFGIFRITSPFAGWFDLSNTSIISFLFRAVFKMTMIGQVVVFMVVAALIVVRKLLFRGQFVFWTVWWVFTVTFGACLLGGPLIMAEVRFWEGILLVLVSGGCAVLFKLLDPGKRALFLAGGCFFVWVVALALVSKWQGVREIGRAHV